MDSFVIDGSIFEEPLKFLLEKLGDKVITQLFKSKSNFKRFEACVTRAAQKLQGLLIAQNIEIDVKYLFRNDAVVKQYIKILSPYAEIDNSTIEEKIDVATLPANFLVKFRELLVAELENDEVLKPFLHKSILHFQVALLYESE